MFQQSTAAQTCRDQTDSVSLDYKDQGWIGLDAQQNSSPVPQLSQCFQLLHNSNSTMQWEKLWTPIYEEYSAECLVEAQN